ncbi:MAG TPA: S8 family peptidase [Solirubrobacteraceae bacterium]
MLDSIPRTARGAAVAALALCSLLALAPPARGASYAPDTVVLKLSSRSHRVAAQERDAGVVATLSVIPKLGVRVVRVTGDPAAVAARLSSRPGVRWAEPNWTMHADAAPGGGDGAGAVPNDPLFGRLDGMAAISAAAGWAAAGLGRFPASGGVPVGIVDTGIDAGHEDLQGKLAACATATDGRVTEGSCADDNGHGTHVAGTIGAVADNGVGVAGVAFSSPLIVCKALSADGSGTLADVAGCLRWAHDRGAKVISMSLGGPGSRALADAVGYAWAGGARSGSVLMAAAGNEGSPTVEFPAGYADVVSVGATGPGDAPASFSEFNADVEVSAPGVDVLSTKAGGGYVSLSGTSMATPHAAGVAAIAWDAHPRAAAATIRERLDGATDDLGAPGRDPIFGFGRVNLLKAVEPQE